MFTKIFLIVVLIFSVLSLFFINTKQSDDERKFIKATLNNAPLKLELALNQSQWYQGLSNQASLCSNCGMLFIFPSSRSETFVMRQMNFSLDVVWLNNRTVIGYNENLAPENEPYTLYKSPDLVTEVLELPAGFVKNNHIKLQDNLVYEKN